MNYPFYDCHLFNGCSINNCPLDPLYPDRYTDKGDKYRKCRCNLDERLSIAENYPELKLKGKLIGEL